MSGIGMLGDEKNCKSRSPLLQPLMLGINKSNETLSFLVTFSFDVVKRKRKLSSHHEQRLIASSSIEIESAMLKDLFVN
jgi:hypothetical protein